MDSLLPTQLCHLVFKLAVRRLVVYKFVFSNVSGHFKRPLPSQLENLYQTGYPMHVIADGSFFIHFIFSHLFFLS